MKPTNSAIILCLIREDTITMSGVIDVQYMKMKYKGFEFDVNPKDFKICMNKSSVKYDTV